jgi:hypothetical protein
MLGEEGQFMNSVREFVKRHKKVVIGLSAPIIVIAITAGACSSPSTDPAQQQAQHTKENISDAAQKAVPFPLPQIQAEGWTERRELSEHAIRENDPHTTRYAALIAPQTGAVVQTWTIEGTVFTPNSQLTNTQNQDYGCSGASGSCSFFDGVVDAPGDNGTWGPEAMCYDFFTTTGGEVQLGCNSAMLFELSDRPFSTHEAPTLSINENAPSGVKDQGQLKGIGGH